MISVWSRLFFKCGFGGVEADVKLLDYFREALLFLKGLFRLLAPHLAAFLDVLNIVSKPLHLGAGCLVLELPIVATLFEPLSQQARSSFHQSILILSQHCGHLETSFVSLNCPRNKTSVRRCPLGACPSS